MKWIAIETQNYNSKCQLSKKKNIPHSSVLHFVYFSVTFYRFEHTVSAFHASYFTTSKQW